MSGNDTARQTAAGEGSTARDASTGASAGEANGSEDGDSPGVLRASVLGASADAVANGSSSDAGANGTDEGRGWIKAIKAQLGLASPSLREVLIEALAKPGEGASEFTDLERDMLNRTLRFGSLRVEDVMVPRADIIAVDADTSIARLLALFKDVGHSRIPVYSETLDDLRGMVHIKDLLTWMLRTKKPTDDRVAKEKNGANDDDGAGNGLRPVASVGVDDKALARAIGSTKLLRQCLFVPPSMPAVNLLLRMQSTHLHLAMVVDEYGGTDGLVSIEDLIEEVVGDIEDEHDDVSGSLIQRDAALGLVASARTPIDELEAFLDVKLLAPEDADEIDTLGGLVFTLVNRVPVRGEVVPHDSGFEFEVLEADPRRIKRLRILGAKKSTEDVAGTTAAATGEGADIAYAPPETDGPPNSGRA